jgi:hypothetical protein
MQQDPPGVVDDDRGDRGEKEQVVPDLLAQPGDVRGNAHVLGG